MGANCCIAAKKPQPYVAPVEVSAYRNVRHSPSWSFRWDNRTHIEDIMDHPIPFSNHSSGNIQYEIKSGAIAPSEGLSNGGSPSDVFQRVKRHKSCKKMEASKVAKADPQAKDQSTASNSSPEAKDSSKSLDMVSVASGMKTSISVPSTPPLVSGADPSSSRSHFLATDSDSMRKARRSPGYQLYRQVSDSKIPFLKSLNENSSPEGRPSSSMLSVCSNDLSAGGSHGESSDGWSMRTFSELVASSQRERWSIDSELLGSITSKITRSTSPHPTTLSPDQEVCKICLKLLKERSSWNAQELAVVSILFCGHAYHADCLDSLTTEVDKYDPPCPVCTYGEKCTAKLFGKLESKIKNKVYRNVIADDDLDEGSNSKNQKKSGKGPSLGTSSSMKSSVSRPFLRRHFSFGSRPSRLVSDSDSTRKKSFWGRHWRE